MTTQHRIDTDRLIRSVDLLAVVGVAGQPRKASTSGGEWATSCLRCGGDDRFLIWPNHPDRAAFYCRRCEWSGDAIAFVQERDNVEFREACEILGEPRRAAASEQRPPRPTDGTRPRATVARVTVATLAADKGLPAEALERYGVSDAERGVRIDYGDVDGHTARSRSRTALRATDGTFWNAPDDAPQTIYTNVESRQRARGLGHMLAVEGESDCWTAWFHGTPAFGIPGSGQWNKIESRHVEGVSTIYVLRELDTDAYARGVGARLDDLDWPGTLRVLVMPDGLDDLNDLHRDDPARFTERLTAAMKSAEVYDANESGVDHPAVGVLLSDVTPERVKWLWRGRIPLGKVTLIDGDPGLGKSACTIDLAARVSTGRLMPDGGSSVAGGVVILSAEDALADTIRPRLDAAGADTDRIVALPTVGSGDDERLPSLPDDLKAVEAAAARVGAILIIIDPLMAFLGSDVNSHKDQDVRRALAQIAQMAERTGAAVVVIRHLNKAQGGKAIYRGGGSIGIGGAARSVLLVVEDPDDPDRRILVPVKANLSAPVPALKYQLQGAANGAVQVEWLGRSAHTATALLAVGAPESSDASSALNDAMNIIEQLLADGPVEATEADRQRKAVSVSEATWRKARVALGVVTTPVYESGRKGVKNWLWGLREDAPARLGDQLVDVSIKTDSESELADSDDHLNDGDHLNGDGSHEVFDL